MEIRRWAWLSREDAEMLRALPGDAAREMSNLLRSQAYGDQRFREATALLELSDLESLEASVRVSSPKRARPAPGDGYEDGFAVPMSLLVRRRERYERYLRSSHWKAVKRRYRASELPQDCHVCGDPNTELHHLTYVRLGHEELTDLLPLCREHYERAHARELSVGLDGSDTAHSPS